MKKLFGVLIFALIAFFILYSPVSSYELNDKDYDVVEKIDNRVIDLIDRREDIDAAKVVRIFEKYLKTQDLSERIEKILLVVIDDIKYEYYLDEYGEDFISAEDCYDDEYYDEVEKTCFLKDDSEFVYDDYQNYVDESDDHSRSENFSEDTEEVTAKYTINKNEIILVDGSHTGENKAIWDLFTKIIPLSYRGDFKEFKIYDNESSDTAAHVAQNSEDIKKWDLTVNLASFRSEDGGLLIQEGTETLIHEFAHVLTLSKTQVKYVPLEAGDDFWAQAQASCPSYFIGEGCLNSTSYLNSFIETFWKENFDESQDEQEDDFYTGKENHFITEYAATNPGEDIAESFAFFVLQAKPTGSDVSDQKLRFFHNYPELVKLRTYIRTRIQK